MGKSRLVLIRHGQSVWNEKNLFTGWVDVGLTEKGRKEAYEAGLALKKTNVSINYAFSSALKPIHSYFRNFARGYGEKKSLLKNIGGLMSGTMGSYREKIKKKSNKSLDLRKFMNGGEALKSPPPLCRKNKF